MDILKEDALCQFKMKLVLWVWRKKIFYILSVYLEKGIDIHLNFKSKIDPVVLEKKTFTDLQWVFFTCSL